MSNFVKCPLTVWGASLETDIESDAQLKGATLDKDEILDVIMDEDGRYALPGTSLVFWADGSTGIDFGHETEGGGWFIVVEDEANSSWNEIAEVLTCSVEWDDTYAQEAGLSEERSDKRKCLSLALSIIQDYIDGYLALRS